MAETDDLKKQLEEEKKKNAYYEQNGGAKLFYALNRKSAEMADILNQTNLKNLDLTDPKDKTFERLKVVWNDAASIATATKALGEACGITNDEPKDTKLPKFRITSPESIADGLGHIAGQIN